MNEIGYIFDLDGTLIDTQLPFHAKAECAVLAEHGIQTRPEDLSARFAGISTRQVFLELAPLLDPDALVREKWLEMDDLFESQDLEILDPLIADILISLENMNVPIAIASASPRYWISRCINKPILDVGTSLTGRYKRSLKSFFGSRFVSAQDCIRPKPSPDVFLKAKGLLEKEFGATKQWVAVGDGESDVKAGLAADMSVVFLSGENAEFDQHKNVSRVRDVKEMMTVFERQLERVFGGNEHE